jgi:mannose-6-phosphate isomerase
MEALRQPLLFAPVYKDYLWGGTRIAERYHRSGTPEVCAESWEIAAHPDGASVVSAGPWAGCTLQDLTRTHGRALLGTRAPRDDHFPLLFKLIDARQRLSVQVHPNEASAPRCGGEPKSEMWVVLECAPGATLFAGLRPGSSPETLRQALSTGSGLDAQLMRLPVAPGDALYIPGGLVHAIGEGCLLYEVQQNSNTTYRLYDWGRTGPDGKPRPLHIDLAFQAIDWQLPVPSLRRPQTPAAAVGANAWNEVMQTPFFRMRRVRLAATETVAQDGNSFHALFVTSGGARVEAGGVAREMTTGDSGLVPAAAGGFRITPLGDDAELLITTL